ncbi:hypothetical protein NC653_041670 [Populus alba x Populus x berolinensis]|uniref:Uncharacterized protein n=1 Tax=Populus alba x Populus x berolinensis TaxID=444605 RepID=A0AAD6LA23_9ROSI|nr:hypothetical protein NC653_041670 [Populus alba x Populus x berolinensis]
MESIFLRSCNLTLNALYKIIAKILYIYG